MEEAKICDRCGEFFIEKEHNIDVYYSLTEHKIAPTGIGFSHTSKKADLCRNCEFELIEWFEKQGEQERDSA